MKQIFSLDNYTFGNTGSRAIVGMYELAKMQVFKNMTITFEPIGTI